MKVAVKVAQHGGIGAAKCVSIHWTIKIIAFHSYAREIEYCSISGFRLARLAPPFPRFI